MPQRYKIIFTDCCFKNGVFRNPRGPNDFIIHSPLIKSHDSLQRNMFWSVQHDMSPTPFNNLSNHKRRRLVLFLSILFPSLETFVGIYTQTSITTWPLDTENVETPTQAVKLAQTIVIYYVTHAHNTPSFICLSKNGL